LDELRALAKERPVALTCVTNPPASEPALARINKMADAGHEGAQALATYWVGQGVGLMNEAMTCRQVVEGFMEDFAGAHETLAACFD